MEDQKNDNIYIYTEKPEENGMDDSGPNYSQADSVDCNKGGRPEEASPGRLLLKVMLSPVEGWKEIRRSRLKPEEVQKSCFYPLTAIMSASKFAELIYTPRIGLPDVVVNAMVSFVSFFFGYFCIVLFLRWLMPKESAASLDTPFGRVFILYSLSTLCLFYSVMELLPMLWAVLIFLPLWTVYIMCRGTRFFRFPEEKQIRSTSILCLLTVGVPIFIGWALEQILP